MNLQPFCATEADPREHLRAPWRCGDFVYATNGVAAVRVPAASRPDITAMPSAAPKAGELFDKTFAHSGEFMLLPPLPAAMKCGACEGAGKLRAIKCPDCDEGTFTRGIHTYECQNCEGSAAGKGWERLYADSMAYPHEVLRCCDVCDGRGYLTGCGEVQLGEALYDPAYLALFASLPQIRIRPGDPASREYTKVTPAAFIFDGGQGMLMPRRK